MHGYYTIKPKQLWNIIEKDIPVLMPQIKQLLDSEKFTEEISKNKAWQCVVTSGNKSTAYYHALFSVYQPLALLRGRCGIKIEKLFSYIRDVT